MEAAVLAAVAPEPGDIFLQSDSDAAQSVTEGSAREGVKGLTLQRHLPLSG